MIKSKLYKNRRKPKKITAYDRLDSAGVYKSKEFADFITWLSIPTHFRGKKEGYLSKLGVTDENAVQLATISNLTEFAEKYELHPGTLSEWKQKAEKLNLIEAIKDFYKKLTTNIYGAFYLETLKHADAARVKLWLEEFIDEPKRLPAQQIIIISGKDDTIQSLRVEYKEKLRKYYEQRIRQSDNKNG